MLQTTVLSHIHYQHSLDEVDELAQAIIPLHDNIVAVSSNNERQKMRRILRGDYFRRADALAVRNMLLRAAKHARAHLADYFPLMRQDILQSAQTLEDAARRYWVRFRREADEVLPVQ
jgi:hypothetical protein